MPERFVTTHAVKHQQSWWTAEGKNYATGNFIAHRRILLFRITFTAEMGHRQFIDIGLRGRRGR
jgi:hypothetical protein